MPSQHRRWLYCCALALLVVLAGCAGADGTNSANEATVGDTDASASQNAESGQKRADAGGASSEFNGAVQQRARIRTGTVSMQVADFEASRKTLSNEARERGGYVSDSQQQVHRDRNQTWVTGKVVLRIPNGEFSPFFERVKGEGAVEESNTNSKDVTDQLVDLDARIANLQAQRDRLRQLYENANGTENVLAVQERLSEVQSKIERLKAKRQSLQQQVAYSTITVKMYEPRPEPETTDVESESWYDVGVVAAFLDSVHGVVVAVQAISVAVAYIAPYLLVFGLPAASVYALRTRWRE